MGIHWDGFGGKNPQGIQPMTSPQRRLSVLYSMRQTYEQVIPVAYRPLFIRDIDRRIRNLERVTDDSLPAIPPITGNHFDGINQ